MALSRHVARIYNSCPLYATVNHPDHRIAKACAARFSLPPLVQRNLNRSDLLARRHISMAGSTIGQITLAYRGETQQFGTVSQAAHFLRQDRIKMGWFHKVQATVDLVEDGKTTQTRNLKGDKFRIITKLEQLEGEVKKSIT
jgi:hypothetical protein